MNEETNELPQPPEESLAEIMPDPAAAPLPVEVEDPVVRGLGIAGVILVTAGGFLLPLSVATSSTQGASRSAKLQWEARQAEVRQAASEASEENSLNRVPESPDRECK